LHVLAKKRLTFRRCDSILLLIVRANERAKDENNNWIDTSGWWLDGDGRISNDCDGACMDTANTLGEMLMVAGAGLTAMAVGGLMLIKANLVNE